MAAPDPLANWRAEQPGVEMMARIFDIMRRSDVERMVGVAALAREASNDQDTLLAIQQAEGYFFPVDGGDRLRRAIHAVKGLIALGGN
jgi:cyanophycinase-like exopeptidase